MKRAPSRFAFAAAFLFTLTPLAILSLVPFGCAGASPGEPAAREDSTAQVELDRFFLRFRQKIQEGAPDSLVRDLSRESLRWLEDMRQAARTEPREYLERRPFHEILCILALRVERRLEPAFDDRPAGLMNRLVLQTAPVRKTFLKTELAGSRVRGGVGEIGVREAPQVPVFHFVRENGLWKFHIARSMPLILQGAESLARQRKSTRLEQAIFLLEQFGDRKPLPEDLLR